jgi:hypothetical protein
VLDLAYPIGKFVAPAVFTDAYRADAILAIASCPGALRSAVTNLTTSQLDTPYRPGGWTVRQLVHHVPDSHLNAYTRFKLTLTEDEPTIKPYREAAWAMLDDTRTAAVETSLTLLETLHDRWVRVLRAMRPEDFERAYRHPEMGLVPLNHAVGMYAWHGRHHVAHVMRLRERERWT